MGAAYGHQHTSREGFVALGQRLSGLLFKARTMEGRGFRQIWVLGEFANQFTAALWRMDIVNSQIR